MIVSAVLIPIFGSFGGGFGGLGGVWKGFLGGPGGSGGWNLGIPRALSGHVGGIFAPRSIFKFFLGPGGSNMGPCWGQVGGMLGPSWPFKVSFFGFLWHPS